MARDTSDAPAPTDPDIPMREGMEGLIVAMKERPPSPRSPDLGTDSTLLQPGNDEPDAPLAGTTPGASGPLPALVRGAIVGRLVILQLLGAGGMGVVYAAYDPELDRKVALKLLRPGSGGAGGRTRLLREAQALAKLSHPSVVAIHDVGTMGEEVWIAMELVQGQTLSAWLGQPRRWREVLATLCRAGEGLAAAHAVDLLHRDFKPDNVMVGDDGRVRVMDFGLARARPSGAASLDLEPSRELPVLDTLALAVTEAGAIVGTPRYMAPEQFEGGELTAAADQFSFCVTLWEALYGERPFGGRSWTEIAANVLTGRLRPPPKGRAVPGWLRRACERGLASDPAQRWPSMAVLLDTLDKGRARARLRRGLAAVGTLALLTAGVEGHRRWDVAQRTAACEATGDEIETAWNDAREQALREAMAATGASFAATTADKTMPWLDEAAEQWRQARIETCLDARVRGTLDDEMLARAQWCLEDRRVDLESLVDLLIAADAKVIQKAALAAASLSEVAPCRDPRMLETMDVPPENRRVAIREVWDTLARASNHRWTGRFDEGVALMREALGRAQALDWPPLTAAAQLRLGSLLERTGEYAEAETMLEEAYFEAAAGVAPQTAFDAASILVLVVGERAARTAEGLRWGRLAEAARKELHDEGELLRARLLDNVGLIQHRLGDYDAARRAYEQSLAIVEALGPEHPLVAASLEGLARVHYATGDHPRAKQLAARTLAVREQALGSDHPHVANAMLNLALLHRTVGEVDEAKALYERGIAGLERGLGPEHPDVATGLSSLAIIHFEAGNTERARAMFERALAIREQALGPDHPLVAASLSNLANFHASAGDHARAAALLERAIPLQEKKLGAEHPELARSLVTLADLYLATGRHDDAKAALERALSIFERKLGLDHPDVGLPLVGLADVALARARPADAVGLAQRAAAVWEARPGYATELARARLTLARAQWEAPVGEGRDRSRAVAAAELARDGYRAAGKAHARELAAAEAWLAGHATDLAPPQ